MEELIFIVEESPERGYTAKGLGVSIFTQGDTMDAIHCYFDDEKKKIIRLHIVKEELIAA
jgi:hypothetical protein